MTFMKLDLSSLASVRAFVADFKASKLCLDSLILNAGVMHKASLLLLLCSVVVRRSVLVALAF